MKPSTHERETGTVEGRGSGAGRVTLIGDSRGSVSPTLSLHTIHIALLGHWQAENEVMKELHSLFTTKFSTAD